MKYLVRFLLIIISIPVVMAVWQYLFCTQFNFANPQPFSGSKVYNPYLRLLPADWIKCNFHAHTNAWSGLTNGSGTARDVNSTYQALGYTVRGVSDYQKINKELARQPGYIPMYEHGYNMKKTHQLVIGDENVTWADFMFPQSTSNKQWLLSQLAASGKAVIVLNHPEVRGGYSINDVTRLQGFNCIEVLNPAARSFATWDAALSAGQPVFITANDDNHDIHDCWDSGRFCTWLNTKAVSKDSILSSLRSGKGYGMEIGFIDNENPATRTARIRSGLPYLEACTVTNDTLAVTFNCAATEIRFIGQNGKLLHKASNSAKAEYAIAGTDTYVRTEAVFPGKVDIYLNPVFRYTSNPLMHHSGYSVNHVKTMWYRTGGIIVLACWAMLMMRVFAGAGYTQRLGAQFKRLREGREPGPVLRNI